MNIHKNGKVRDVYDLGEKLLIVTSDRISVFDSVFSEIVPGKGTLLNQIAAFWFDKTQDVICNHKIGVPEPNEMLCMKCKPIPLEIIVRGYLVGSLYRDYAAGKREKCGIALPEGLKEGDPLPLPLVTPTTKGAKDHDITAQEAIKAKIVTRTQWNQICNAALALYERGENIASAKGLILVDTKYEFGFDKVMQLTLIDEIHTPDSSRYWLVSDREAGKLNFLDKEFLRQWVRAQGWKEGFPLPHLTPEIIAEVQRRYRLIYDTLIGEKDENSRYRLGRP
ncbi:MAG: phosphoribosylaminoimidazolesuccinocarboxamide synthase [Chlamydiia bacterium]|nr:phosphoribosylaminoimidazolesuccinocarboxamide synthase [Chlamydiia bacterium]